MKPTTWRELLAAGAVAGVIVWAIVYFSYDSLPPIPPNATISLTFVAGAGLVTFVNLRSRLLGHSRPVTPLQLARLAALAKAFSVVGALAVGGWLGLLVRVLGGLEVGAQHDDAITGAIALVPSIGVMVAGLLLERLCRAKEPADDDDSR